MVIVWNLIYTLVSVKRFRATGTICKIGWQNVYCNILKTWTKILRISDNRFDRNRDQSATRSFHGNQRRNISTSNVTLATLLEEAKWPLPFVPRILTYGILTRSTACPTRKNNLNILQKQLLWLIVLDPWVVSHILLILIISTLTQGNSGEGCTVE